MMAASQSESRRAADQGGVIGPFPKEKHSPGMGTFDASAFKSGLRGEIGHFGHRPACPDRNGAVVMDDMAAAQHPASDPAGHQSPPRASRRSLTITICRRELAHFA